MIKKWINRWVKKHSKLQKQWIEWVKNECWMEVEDALMNHPELLNVNVTIQGQTVLNKAVELGLWRIAKCLIEAGAVLEVRQAKHDPLWVAIDNRQEKVACLLVNAGLELNAQGKDGHYREWKKHYLSAAMKWGAPNLVDLLFKKNVDVHGDPKSETPLWVACKEGRLDWVEALVDAGVNIHQKSVKGESALTMACLVGSESIARYLIDKGVEFDRDSCSLLNEVIKNYATNIACLLIENDYLEKTNHSVSSALYLATRRGLNVVCQKLLEKGGNVNEIYLENAKTESQEEEWISLLHWATLLGYKDLVELFIQSGADVNVKNSQGDTALMCAAEDHYLNIVNVLLQAGARVNDVDHQGNTALIRVAAESYSQSEGGLNVVDRLLEAGGDIHEKNKEGDTALLVAAKNGSLTMVVRLLKAGSVLNEANNKGMTALMCAANNNDLDLVKVLLEEGAKVHAVNHEGQRASDLVSKDHEPLRELLGAYESFQRLTHDIQPVIPVDPKKKTVCRL